MVLKVAGVQADEMTSIQRYDRTTGGNRELQHNCVRNGLVCLPQFRERDDVLSQAT